ncbi:MAG: hypothetical protein P8Z75_10105 [Gammaproteobacteria bacterium]|jgi:hypothetical protein
MSIHNDSEFKSALDQLPVAEQRKLAARFAQSVSPLCKDSRVAAAIEAGLQSVTGDDKLTPIYNAVRGVCVESYTECGHMADWANQAGHFVAEAAAACVMPEVALHGANPAWDAAMRARMARTCASIADGSGTETSEAKNQYHLLDEYLNA